MAPRTETPTLSPGNHIYLYRLLRDALGAGKQTFLPAVEEALASEYLGAEELGFASTRELLERQRAGKDVLSGFSSTRIVDVQDEHRRSAESIFIPAVDGLFKKSLHFQKALCERWRNNAPDREG